MTVCIKSIYICITVIVGYKLYIISEFQVVICGAITIGLLTIGVPLVGDVMVDPGGIIVSWFS